MKKGVKIVFFFVIVIFLAGIPFISSVSIGNDEDNQTDSLFNDLEPFFETISIIRSEFIEKDIDITQLVQGAMRGMLQELDDPYSRYLDPVSFQREQENLFMGHFDGLGIIVTIVDDQLTVISPIEDTPAYQAGIKTADEIIKIDGESTMGMTLDDAVNILRGEKGTQVILTVKRENVEETLEIEITRDTITVDAVKEKLLEDEQIGYIRISTFNANTGPELKEVLNEFAKKSLEGIIVDLRNNPGGLLDSAIEVASQFVKEGAIVRIKGRNNVTKVYDSQGNRYPEWPLVVLVNKGSASASEIVSGAIQDGSLGTIMGETTFGKGLVQQVYSLSDKSAVIVSTSEYYTPKGRVINHIGIEPDIVIPVKTEAEEESETETKEDIQLDAAIHFILQGKVPILSGIDEE